MGGELIAYLGFLLPKRITDPEGKSPPVDVSPRASICDYCHRLRDETYARWDGVRVCDLCIDGQVNRTRRVRAIPRPLLPERPEERTGVIGDKFAERKPEGGTDTYQNFWERHIV